MDATCKVQDNIHVFRLVHNMCPGFWVHIIALKVFSSFDMSLNISLLTLGMSNSCVRMCEHIYNLLTIDCGYR